MRVFDSERLMMAGKFDFSDKYYLERVEDRYNFWYQDDSFWKYRETQLDSILGSLERAKALGIKVFVFVSVQHPFMTERELDSDLTKKEFFKFREELLERFGSFQDFNLLPEEFLVNQNFYDDTHPRPFLAKKALENLISGGCCWITKDNWLQVKMTFMKRFIRTKKRN